jgi:hypothetical protein
MRWAISRSWTGGIQRSCWAASERPDGFCEQYVGVPVGGCPCGSAKTRVRRRRTELSRAFGAWLLRDANRDSEFASLVRDAATRQGAQQDFQTVAILGFGANAGILAADETESLKKGLRRLAGRGVVIDELPAAFCSDAVGVLGVVLGTKAVGDTQITDQVVQWISKFLKRSYDADRTEEWQRCLFAAGDIQLGSLLNLPIPKIARYGRCSNGTCGKGRHNGWRRPIGGSRRPTYTQVFGNAELADELPHDRAALRLAAVESVVRAAVPVVGGKGPASSPKGSQPLSERDVRVHDAIGRERFCSLTNAEIMRDTTVKKPLRAEGLDPGEAAKRCLDRIRNAKGYPLSRAVSKKRASRN